MQTGPTPQSPFGNFRRVEGKLMDGLFLKLQIWRNNIFALSHHRHSQLVLPGLSR
jgi:hypothetical protein